MTILEGAFPETISPEVKALFEEYFYLSNAASSHNEHKASKSFDPQMYAMLRLELMTESSHSLDEKAFAELFTPDGTYEFAEVQNTGHEGIYSPAPFTYVSIRLSLPPLLLPLLLPISPEPHPILFTLPPTNRQLFRNKQPSLPSAPSSSRASRTVTIPS